jgi:hypothetical protein
MMRFFEQDSPFYGQEIEPHMVTSIMDGSSTIRRESTFLNLMV